jgi:hypothetical protein
MTKQEVEKRKERLERAYLEGTISETEYREALACLESESKE